VTRRVVITPNPAPTTRIRERRSTVRPSHGDLLRVETWEDALAVLPVRLHARRTAERLANV
jgi:hypothetical protein